MNGVKAKKKKEKRAVMHSRSRENLKFSHLTLTNSYEFPIWNQSSPLKPHSSLLLNSVRSGDCTNNWDWYHKWSSKAREQVVPYSNLHWRSLLVDVWILVKIGNPYIRQKIELVLNKKGVLMWRNYFTIFTKFMWVNLGMNFFLNACRLTSVLVDSHKLKWPKSSQTFGI